jgi:hypothetical protein
MKKTLALILLFVFFISNGQDYKFGKVSKSELQEKTHPIDSSANAAVLYKKEHITFQFVNTKGFMQNREVHERIKIYSKEGYDWATKKVYVYKGSSGGNSERIIDIKGYTYNLEGNKVAKEKLKNDGIFEEEYNDFNEINTITMPNIQDGCIIEYTYTIVSPFYAIDDIYFQSTIPINKLDVKVASPQFAQYNRLANLRASFFPKFKESRENKSIGNSTVDNSSQTFRGDGISQNKFEYYNNVLEASETNIPALKEEGFVSSMENYISKMSFELSAILNEFGAPEKSFSSSWEKVSETIYKRKSFGNQINKTNFFEDDVASVTDGVTDACAKAASLAEYVKSKVKWNGYYGAFAYKGTKEAFNEGEGNVADINLLLIAMLKSQGVEANPVLVSTRNNGIPLYPTTKGFNYVICMVENQGEFVLIDATEKFSTLNVLPERVLNWQGRLVKDDGTSSWVSLMPSNQSQQSTSLNIKIDEDTNISGKVRQIITSNLALRYNKRYQGLSSDDQIKLIEKDKGAIEVSNVELAIKDKGALSVSYSYNLSDAVDNIGDKLYFSPLLFMAEKENPFKLDERQYPIDFTMPLKQKYMINIMLPQGYTVETIPESEVMEFKEGTAKYKFIAKQNGNFVQLSTEFDLKTPIIDAVDYSVFKVFFGKVVEKQAEQIVLKKI